MILILLFFLGIGLAFGWQALGFAILAFVLLYLIIAALES